MEPFADILARAVKHKGSAELEASLPSPLSNKALTTLGDDRYLAEMTRNIFRSGFSWKVIEKKWPGFEEALAQFNIRRNAFLSDEDIDALASDTRIVRNRIKILSIRENAAFIMEASEERGGFGSFLADWPLDDIVGLMKELKTRGSRLGGNTGLLFLRFVGKDTFVFSADVVKTLIQQGIVTKTPTSQRDLKAVQEAFNTWREESNRPLCQISRILAASQG